MKKILIMILAIAGVLFATSCSKDDKEETILTLSQKAITFKSDGEEKSIAVTSNEAWQAEGPTWLELRQEEKKLVLKVAPNKTLEELKGEVKVVAGSLIEIIKVTQQGMEGKATITPESLELGEGEGTTTVKVVANVDSWTAKADVDWLTVTPKPENDELLIKHTKNSTAEDRKGVITVMIGKTKKTINIIQRTLFILPYLDFKNPSSVITSIDKFEKNRNSIFKGKTDTEEIIYETNSKLFNKMVYFFRGGIFVEVDAFASSVDMMQQKQDEFKSFLAKKGFKYLPNSNGEELYSNEKLSVKAKIVIGKKSAGVVYLFEPKQKEDLQTFNKLPWIHELSWGATEKQIEDYEKANGGVLNQSITKKNPNAKYDRLGYDVTTNDAETPYRRLYLLGHHKTVKNHLIFQDLQFRKISFAFYKADNGEYKITKEFLQLAKEEGFTFNGVNNLGAVDFESKEKNAIMIVAFKKYNGDDTQTLDIMFQRKDAQNKQASAYCIDSYFDMDILKKKERFLMK